MGSAGSVSKARVLRARITCPHCWHQFPPQEVRWIASHPELRGDERLGEDAPKRFLPTRFDKNCRALDAKGQPCTQLACPRCHLFIPWVLLEVKPLLISILGAPGSGKSYFLAASVWRLRQTLLEQFHLQFLDSDPRINQVLLDYEERLFLSAHPDELTLLPKTETKGHLYESVRIAGELVWYPKPFVFTLQPAPSHPNARHAARLTRAMCLYDNAGEHFLPGGDSPESSSTQHLSHSQALLFLFDPTQHPRIRQLCCSSSNDPQLHKYGWSHRQDYVLSEAANRIRLHRGLGQREKLPKPLVVVVTKFDAWKSLVEIGELELSQVVVRTRSGISYLDLVRLESTSRVIRRMLERYVPELVATCWGVSDDVIFIPVSSLGTSPEVVDQGTGPILAVRPGKVRPAWAEVPFLYVLQRTLPGVIPVRKLNPNSSPTQEKTP